MAIKLDNYVPILLLCFAAVSLLPAPKWLKTGVGIFCGIAAVVLLIHNLAVSA